MKELVFEVSGQKLTRIDKQGAPVKGTKSYLKCKFKYADPDWIGGNVICVFIGRNYENAVIVDRSGTCMIPDDVCDLPIIRFYLVGVRGETKIKTNTIFIRQG